MKIYDILILNRMLSRLKISGGNITRETRVKIIDLRNLLGELEKKALEYRENTQKQCADEKDAEATFTAAMDGYANRDAEIDFHRLTPAEFESVVELSPLELSEYEYIEKQIVGKPECNGRN